MAWLALTGIGVAVLTSWRQQINPGVAGAVVALILGRVAQITDKTILSYWPVSLTHMLISVTFLYGYAVNNGTLTSLSTIILGKVSERLQGLIPIVFFVLCFVISAVGPGALTVFALLTPIALDIAQTFGLNPVVMALAVVCGGSAGHLSPVAVGGLVAGNLMISSGEYGHKVWAVSAIVEGTFFILMFLILKGWRQTQKAVVMTSTALTRDQKLTLTVLIAVLIMTVFFRVDVTLASFTGILACALFKVGSESEAMKAIPLRTIITLCGMGMLVGMLDKMGTIAALTAQTQLVPRPELALTLAAGAMSMVSSTTGVVMPVLYPTVPALALKASQEALLYGAIAAGAMGTGISPISSAGALVLANAPEEMIREYKLYGTLTMLIFARLAWTLGIISVLRWLI